MRCFVMQLTCHPSGKGLPVVILRSDFPRDGDGFDYRRINRPIDGTILGAQQITVCLDRVVKAGMIEGVLDWVPEG